jgi:hypothetical protein
MSRGSDIGKQGDAVTVGSAAGADQNLSVWPAGSHSSGLLINCWLRDHFPGSAVDQEQRPIGDGGRTRYADDGRNAERPSDDRGMRGSSAPFSEDGQAARSIEPGSVRWRKINCDQDEGVSRVWYAWDRTTGERGGHAVADVVEVGNAFCLAGTGCADCVGDRPDGLPHGTLWCEAAVLDAPVRIRNQIGVGGHDGTGFEQLAHGPSSGAPTP